jgi:Pyruvate/2-oxoacid:ferredoxin oxidoreductase delta subunit
MVTEYRDREREVEMQLRVKEALCSGCGLCVENCPQQAISLQSGQARIDQSRCNKCGLCRDVCPRMAIVELVPVSTEELHATIASLKRRTGSIIERIESIHSGNAGPESGRD